MSTVAELCEAASTVLRFAKDGEKRASKSCVLPGSYSCKRTSAVKKVRIYNLSQARYALLHSLTVNLVISDVAGRGILRIQIPHTCNTIGIIFPACGCLLPQLSCEHSSLHSENTRMALSTPVTYATVILLWTS